MTNTSYRLARAQRPISPRRLGRRGPRIAPSCGAARRVNCRSPPSAEASRPGGIVDDSEYSRGIDEG